MHGAITQNVLFDFLNGKMTSEEKTTKSGNLVFGLGAKAAWAYDRFQFFFLSLSCFFFQFWIFKENTYNFHVVVLLLGIVECFHVHGINVSTFLRLI